MIFNCWVSLWRPPEAPFERAFERLIKSLADVELNMTFQHLEPIIYEAMDQSGARLLKVRAESVSLDGMLVIPAVYFDFDATAGQAIEVLKIMRESEDQLKIKAHVINHY